MSLPASLARATITSHGTPALPKPLLRSTFAVTPFPPLNIHPDQKLSPTVVRSDQLDVRLPIASAGPTHRKAVYCESIASAEGVNSVPTGMGVLPPSVVGCIT